MKFYVRGSVSRRDAEAKIEDNTRNLILHLIKLWLYPDNDSKLHWRKEVATYLYEVPTLKGRNKPPSAKFILDSSWNIHKSKFNYYLEYILVDYGESNVDTTGLYDAIQTYFNWIADMLSVKMIVPHKTIYNKLDELGF